MSDISANERRLIGALDRLDHAIERGGQRLARLAERGGAAASVAAPLAAPVAAPVSEAPPALAEQPASAELAALHDRQNATLEAMRARLAEAHERLAALGEQAGRLATANDALAAANRALIAAAEDWAGRGEDATRAALQAEVEALRAARAAEIAQMGEIMDALDRMLGVETTIRRGSDPRPVRGGTAPVSGGVARQGEVTGGGKGDLRPPRDAGTPSGAAASPLAAASAAPQPAEGDPAPATDRADGTVAAPSDPDAGAGTDAAGSPPRPLKVHSASVHSPAAHSATPHAAGASGQAPAGAPGRELTVERDPAGPLFGGVYGDDPDDIIADEEDR